MIQWSECSIVFSLFSKSHCSPCHPATHYLPYLWHYAHVVFVNKHTGWTQHTFSWGQWFPNDTSFPDCRHYN
jgi:hypothetical protein